MTPAGKPGNPIEINYRRDFCHRHLRFFKRHWPKGVALFSSLVFQAFVRVDEVMEFARDGGDVAKVDRLPLAMAEFGPLCCAVGHQMIHDIRVYALNPNDRTKSVLVAGLVDFREEEE